MTAINMAEVTGPYAPPTPPLNPLMGTVESLNQQVTGLNLRVDRLSGQVRGHSTAWDELGDYLTEMADKHSLCSVYDEAVAEWNGDHPDHPLPVRKVEIDTVLTVRITGTFRRGTDGRDVRQVVEDQLNGLVYNLDTELDADSYVELG